MSSDQQQQAQRRAVTRQHLIERVEFQANADAGRPTSEAPVWCSCGAVTTSGEWDLHRGPTSDTARKAAWAEAA